MVKNDRNDLKWPKMIRMIKKVRQFFFVKNRVLAFYLFSFSQYSYEPYASKQYTVLNGYKHGFSDWVYVRISLFKKKNTLMKMGEGGTQNVNQNESFLIN